MMAEFFAPAGSWLLLSGSGQSVSFPALLPHAVPWLLRGENAALRLAVLGLAGAAAAAEAAGLLSDKPAASAAATAMITPDGQRLIPGRRVRFIETSSAGRISAAATGGLPTAQPVLVPRVSIDDNAVIGHKDRSSAQSRSPSTTPARQSPVTFCNGARDHS
jgi:hypothetical protein